MLSKRSWKIFLQNERNTWTIKKRASVCEGQGLKPSRNNCVFKCVFFKHNTSACLKCHKLCWTIKYLRTTLLNLMARILNVHNWWNILLNGIRSLKCIFKRYTFQHIIVNSYSYPSSFHMSFKGYQCKVFSIWDWNAIEIFHYYVAVDGWTNTRRCMQNVLYPFYL